MSLIEKDQTHLQILLPGDTKTDKKRRGGITGRNSIKKQNASKGQKDNMKSQLKQLEEKLKEQKMKKQQFDER